jgi:predicted alpha/beta superfamily hydrolase
MTQWLDYPAFKGDARHTVVGNVKVLPGLHCPQINNRRDILVYLPPSYENSDRRYPVLYFHDGQNLFDAGTSFAGEWHVDETMEKLAGDGLEAIVVGIPNAGVARLDEYSPFKDPVKGGGLGDAYVSFIAETLKPLIDAAFRTRPERESTAILGSSMGGLISLYAFFHSAHVFGLCAVMSPSLWFAQEAIFPYIQEAGYTPGRIYMDVGTREHGGGRRGITSRLGRSRRYYASVRRMQRLLVRKGYQPRRELLYVEEKWAQHEERAWARRLPRAIRFLLDPPLVGRLISISPVYKG